jgi:tRNA (cytidine/uridine-2'-O-)-methyltransferase
LLHICLYEPEIPPNTGNIIRLCANMGARLHLIKPLGFSLDVKSLKRAGLDYHDSNNLSQYDSWLDFLRQHPQQRIFAVSTKGAIGYTQVSYQDEDILLLALKHAVYLNP